MNVKAQVTDTNHQPKGVLPVAVEFTDGRPAEINHAGKTYSYTGKTGNNRQSGEAVFEMATPEDARLWANATATKIWED